MRSTLLVLQDSDSFGALWTGLAAATDVVLRVAPSPPEDLVLGQVTAVVLNAAGAETEAAERVAELIARGARALIVVCGDADHRLAAAVVRAGAADFFALPGDVEAVRTWVADRVAGEAAERAARSLAEAQRAHYDFTRLIGESAELRSALDMAARIIPHASASVLLTGETGTGKELLAQAIHYNGPRAAQPFIDVNCSALPATLLEAELFGYEKGAFTDARAAKPGLFEAADGGTLFLDEIGELSLELQAKLLRALEQRQIRRLGALRTIAVDVRIIAATHVDLPAAVAGGRFREDLYYRLGVVPIALPPLRRRGQDVIILAEHFLSLFASSYDIPRPALSRQQKDALMSHDWPGNVRELRNAIERAVLLGDGVLLDEHLLTPSAAHRSADSHGLPFPATLDAIATAAARLALERVGGNKSAAAELLGISRSRLYRLLDGDADV